MGVGAHSPMLLEQTKFDVVGCAARAQPIHRTQNGSVLETRARVFNALKVTVRREYK